MSLLTNDLKLLPYTMKGASGLVRAIDRVDRGWCGVGSYQDGRPVIHRRPLDANTRFSNTVGDLHTKRVLAHVQDKPESSYSPENTQPFRYKHWLFALSGTLGGGGLLQERTLERIPDFLRQNIQGTLPPELVFHLFLALLHEDARLPVQRDDTHFIRRALARTTRLLPELAEKHGDIEFSLLLCNGEHIFGATHGRQLFYRTVDGLTRVDPQTKREEVNHWVRATFVSNFMPDGEESHWQALPAEHFLECDADFRFNIVPLDQPEPDKSQARS